MVSKKLLVLSNVFFSYLVLIEFAADDQTPYFNTKLNKNSEIILVCGAGGQAALSGKTLIEMGYNNVKNVGGIGDWEKNNGPMDK